MRTVSPLGAYWYVFLESTLSASLSFQARSSTRCHGVSTVGMMNLMSVPATKHCHAGVGQLCDHVRGDNNGDDGEVGSAVDVGMLLEDKYLPGLQC